MIHGQRPPTSSKGDCPPRLFGWILGWALPADRRGRSIQGDLLEEWYGRPVGLRRSIWYSLEVMRLAARYLFVERQLPGLSEADRRRRLGGGSRRGGVTDRLIGDVHYAVGSLRREVAFTVTAVVILALGIGATTAVFAAFKAVALKELPVTEPERLVHLSLQTQSGTGVTLSPEEISEVADGAATMQAAAGVSAFGAEAFPMTENGRPLVLGMSSVSANFFDVLGARPVLGRLLRPADGDEGAERVAVITYETWQRDFGGDPDVLGRRLLQTQTGRSYAVVGVTPPGLEVPVGVGYWIPTGPPGHRAWGGAAMEVIARVAREASVDVARTEFLSLAQAVDARRSRPRSPEVAIVQSLTEAVLGDVKPMLLAITTAASLLLLIACVNVGNLLLIRTTRRSREVMVRRALGASSHGIVRLLLTENVLLGVAGGVLGLVLASWLLGVLPGLAPDRLPRSEMIGLTGTPVAVAISVSMAALLLFGVLPPLIAARGNLASALRVDGRSGTGTRARRRGRRALVALQVALAVVLLFGAGLVMRSLQQLQGLDVGYNVQDVGIVEVSLDRQGRGPEETFALLASVLDRIRQAPGVTSATWIMSRPFMGTKGILAVRPTLEGQTEADGESNPQFPVEVGGGEFFPTLGIPVVRGRGLSETDREGAPRVAVVSQKVAERLWPGEDPLGKRIQMVTSRPDWWTVVGVAGDTRFRRLRDPTPTIYVHYRQLQVLPAVWTVAVRTDQDTDLVLPGLRQAVREFGGSVEVWRTGTLSDFLERGPLSEPRITAALLSGFGLAALLLAAIGLYGVMGLAVRERTHELGVRKALGASSHRLRLDVLADALGVTIVGTAAGLGVALLLSRLLSPLLFEVEPWDPGTVLGVCATLLGVGVLAAYLPARRATVVDPTEALRAG